MKKKDWKCKLGWHEPDTIDLELIIGPTGYAVANATIRCKKCGAFLTGISSKKLKVQSSASKVKSSDYWFHEDCGTQPLGAGNGDKIQSSKSKANKNGI